LNPYAALSINAALCALVATILLFMSRILGRRRGSTVKYEIFETGNPPIGSLRGTRFPVKFYLTAILFIVFDIEVIFMYPWAVAYRQLGWSGLAEMAVFMGVLAVGLAYSWRVGALEWN
jgi:NADH-quinone oxidoreductase subunit A